MADQMRGWERKHIFVWGCKEEVASSNVKIPQKASLPGATREDPTGSILNCGLPKWSLSARPGKCGFGRLGELSCPNYRWTLEQGWENRCEDFWKPKARSLFTRPRSISAETISSPIPRWLGRVFTHTRQRYNVYRFEALDGKCELAHLLAKWICSLEPPF